MKKPMRVQELIRQSKIIVRRNDKSAEGVMEAVNKLEEFKQKMYEN